MLYRTNNNIQFETILIVYTYICVATLHSNLQKMDILNKFNEKPTEYPNNLTALFLMYGLNLHYQS